MMKQVYVGFSHNSGIFSKLIRRVSSSEVSHTFRKLPLPSFGQDGRFMVHHAQGLIVHYVFCELFLKKSTIVEEYVVWVEDSVYEKAESTRIETAGLPYSYLQIVGCIWVLLNRFWFKRRVKNPFRNGGSAMVCIELTARELGLTDINGIGLEEATPEDLRKWCVENGQRVKN